MQADGARLSQALAGSRRPDKTPHSQPTVEIRNPKWNTQLAVETTVVKHVPRALTPINSPFSHKVCLHVPYIFRKLVADIRGGT